MKVIRIPKFSRIKPLAKLLSIDTETIMRDIIFKHRRSFFLHERGLWFQFKSIQDIIIPFQTAKLYAESVLPEIRQAGASKGVIVEEAEVIQAPALSPNRIPVVALLGHFDHGKTTLLDTLAKSKITSTEVGGITQVVRTRYLDLGRNHLSTTSAPLTVPASLPVTFVDTPGQDIFYRMRNYGAMVADAAVLVVAVDEGVIYILFFHTLFLCY